MHRAHLRHDSSRRFTPTAEMPVRGGRLITILGVPYICLKTHNGGDLYLTRFGLQVHDLLAIENWFEDEWFCKHRFQLEGTSTVFRVPTRSVKNRSLNLVVKNCRVGEDVPIDTHTVEAALGAEFNSPWEEFSLVMELREGAYGPREFGIATQRPLAIYVPPDFMQLWQSGRSRAKINSILARHPGIDLDILRQYKLIYEWIPGLNVVELLKRGGIWGNTCDHMALNANAHVTAELERKGYWVADMKPQHIIIPEDDVGTVLAAADASHSASTEERVMSLLDAHHYAVIDYELLVRTQPHESQVRVNRRQSYLVELSRSDADFPLPTHLSRLTLYNTDYVTGTVQSTGGQLFIVGKNPNLYEYFLPERWRKTALWRMAKDTELSFTVTKDGLYLLWVPSRIGEAITNPELSAEHRYLDPFELFSTLRTLHRARVPVVSPCAIYRTGTNKTEPAVDFRSYENLKQTKLSDGSRVLREDLHYLMIFRVYTSDFADSNESQTTSIPRPVGLLTAQENGMVHDAEVSTVVHQLKCQIEAAGFDASAITADDLLVLLDEHDQVRRDSDGVPHGTLHDAELLITRK